jgi:transcriptional regulator with XRE-family HTH domain
MTTLTVLRKQMGMTQLDLAQELGIARQEVSRLESGWQVKVRQGVEKKLTDIFGSSWTLKRLLSEPRIR